ncbi:MAG: universal stress protein [Caenispirillum sp.]|nr:universal stress protein [Caenispirillum sp.]
MPKILACTDGSAPYSASVYEHAGWAAKRMAASVEVLHVLDPAREKASVADFTGTIGVDARDELLEQLAELEAAKAKVAQKKGRLILDDAQARLRQLGLADVVLTQRHGTLIDTLHELEESADLVIIGKRGETHDVAGGHLGANLERAIRSSRKPVLVASRAFRHISRVLIAFDGSATAKKAVEYAARQPLLKGLRFDVLNVKPGSKAAPEDLAWAEELLVKGGAEARVVTVDGSPDEAIAAHVNGEAIDLIVMGAYGHSRIRQLIIGSTTTETIRTCQVPLLMFR